MKKLFSYLFLGFFLTAVGTVSVFGQCEDEKESSKLYAVAFHADYCGACKKIAPSLMELEEKLEGQPVKFVKFDFTNDEKKEMNHEMASGLGLKKILSENSGTGYVILVDAESKKSVGKLTTKHSISEMLALVEKNLQAAH
ncbi:MAG: hypothetical protein JSV24_05620 [Bacteroidales bacterium]|nr:MAG: hypothetical protein JSV24_05620 [Bacteroidales bacterium]